MRGNALLAGLALLAGCHKPSFDERFAKAQKDLAAKEASIDKELNDRASEAATVPVAASSSPAP